MAVAVLTNISSDCMLDLNNGLLPWNWQNDPLVPIPKQWLAIFENHCHFIESNRFHSETIDHSIIHKSYHCSGLCIYGNCKICVILCQSRLQSWLRKFCQSVEDCTSQQVARVFSSDVFPIFHKNTLFAEVSMLS